MKKLALFAAGSCLLAPGFGSAQELGHKGDAIFSAERLMGIAATHEFEEGPPDRNQDVTAVSFGWRLAASPYETPRVAFDYVVLDQFSIGGSLGYASYAPDGGNNVSLFLLSGRAGFLHSFSHVIAIWPRGGFTYHNVSTDPNRSENGFGLDLECPFTFSPTAHFAFEVGPAFDIDLFGKNDPGDPPSVNHNWRSFGIHAGLLGWL